MARALVLILAIFAVGCGGSGSNSTASAGPTTPMAGTWSVIGNAVCTTGCAPTAAITYQVTLISSPCSVTAPLGTFSVQGPVCFIANNNALTGSITGAGISTVSKKLGQGVLVGVAANPVPNNATASLVFVSAAGGGNYVEFTGTGTLTNGKMTGTGACNSTLTSLCSGVSATFAATEQ